MKYLLIVLGLLLISFLYSACLVSGRYSRIEEMEELKIRMKEKE